jgi:S-methylmethionine-dependent homocysteine/selenocysteine methylase
MNPFKESLYLTDGGLETTLIFDRGVSLRHFAAFELLTSESGMKTLREYYIPYMDVAKKHGVSFILETPTWRANPDWGYKLGYSPDQLNAINRNAVQFFRSLKGEFAQAEFIVSGCLGPRGDGYVPAIRMTAEESQAYHHGQVNAFALADADAICAMTLNYTEEAIGIVEASRQLGIPVVISFTVETNGNLPDGTPLSEAITGTDRATKDYCCHYMINCAHPEHFQHLFAQTEQWHRRIGGIRANASRKSHAELDDSLTIDKGDACLLAGEYQKLFQLLPHLKVIGGCCGTGHEHIREIMKQVYA